MSHIDSAERDRRMRAIEAARSELRKLYKAVAGNGALDGSQLDQLERDINALKAAIIKYRDLPG